MGGRVTYTNESPRQVTTWPIEQRGQQGHPLFLEREDPLPISFHADHRPALLFRLVIERGSKGANPGVRQALRGAVGILADRVVMQQQHLKPVSSTGTGPLQHFAVAG